MADAWATSARATVNRQMRACVTPKVVIVLTQPCIPASASLVHGGPGPRHETQPKLNKRNAVLYLTPALILRLHLPLMAGRNLFGAEKKKETSQRRILKATFLARGDSQLAAYFISPIPFSACMTSAPPQASPLKSFTNYAVIIPHFVEQLGVSGVKF